MRRKRYVVACLAGDGIGPELTAEATRALRAVSKMHGFRVDELHAPFGREAVARFGHALPVHTRNTYRVADAVLIASTRDPAVEGVKADLDLTWRVQRVRVPAGGDLTIVSPLVAESELWTVQRAFEIARSRRARVSCVSESDEWRTIVNAVAERHEGVLLEHLTLAEAFPLLAYEPQRFCVVLTEQPFADGVSGLAASSSDNSRIVASGRLSEHGPGIFGPTHGSAPDIAGQGVANPSGILLAASLLLAEGLGERAAARTLERAVTDAIESGVRTADLPGDGAAATTRSFMDAVLELLPGARTDVEFFPEYAA
jgi:3-isopropylmalate dehydrogenase